MTELAANDLLDPVTLAQKLTAAALSEQTAAAHGSASVAAARTALEVTEKTVALLRAKLAIESRRAGVAPRGRYGWCLGTSCGVVRANVNFQMGMQRP